eukprot:CAMPEP_0184683646 /NCGR_PEP_ID=MMETSP0312-20130426/12015_1 /TAXON_ID=31354 /ORGANISM="Compsopogon coeruleus, Strain SAG 36.94" /LENGTH=208 /DNA_ID=CAMNT_0027136121 /DNA_START=94 /DNA_END=720 /DNA_ORIENTATION=-
MEGGVVGVDVEDVGMEKRSQSWTSIESELSDHHWSQDVRFGSPMTDDDGMVGRVPRCKGVKDAGYRSRAWTAERGLEESMESDLGLVPIVRKRDDATDGIPSVNKRRRKNKVYDNPKASNFCHLCGRKNPRMTCSNINTGSCLKSVCGVCFTKNGWDLMDAIMLGWICTHCRGVCPSSARCSSYQRAVDQRRERISRERLSKSATRTR